MHTLNGLWVLVSEYHLLSLFLTKALLLFLHFQALLFFLVFSEVSRQIIQCRHNSNFTYSRQFFFPFLIHNFAYKRLISSPKNRIPLTFITLFFIIF